MQEDLEYIKEVTEAVSQWRTDNTMTKRKGQTMIYKTLHRKLKIK